MAVLSKLVGVLREFGLAAGVLYLVDRLLKALPGESCGLYAYEFVAQRIGGADLLPARLARNISFRELGEDDEAVARMPARAEVKRQRFANGARCLAVMRKGELLGYVWFSSGRYEEDEVRCTYHLPRASHAAAESVFDFDLYLFPEHRMGIGFVALWHAASRYLQGRGVVCTYSRITRTNLASRRAHLRLGARIVGRALFLRLGHCEVMVSTLRPFVSLTRKVRVHLTLPRSLPD